MIVGWTLEPEPLVPEAVPLMLALALPAPAGHREMTAGDLELPAAVKIRKRA